LGSVVPHILIKGKGRGRIAAGRAGDWRRRGQSCAAAPVGRALKYLSANMFAGASGPR
jgi:hypothetical protein